MAQLERITITLPGDLIAEIDRWDQNRSRFVVAAVRVEIERRRRQELLRSLEQPHSESEQIAEAGFDDWAAGVADQDASGLVEGAGGTPVRWTPAAGWQNAAPARPARKSRPKRRSSGRAR